MGRLQTTPEGWIQTLHHDSIFLVDKAGTLRTWATPRHIAASPASSAPLAHPSSPMPPALLSHNPTKASSFFFFFKSRPIVPGRMGRAASCTMQAPFSQDVRWSSQGRKNAYDGASSAHCLPLPSRLSHQPCLSDYHSLLVQTHFAQLTYHAPCPALCKNPQIFKVAELHHCHQPCIPPNAG